MQVVKQKTRPTAWQALVNATLGLVSVTPMIIGILLIVGVLQSYMTPVLWHDIFKGDTFYDTVIGTLAGAVAIGQAMVGYIVGGELLQEGISLFAITAFILAWVTIGVVQMPMEAKILGTKFMIIHNILALIMTPIMAWLMVFALHSMGLFI